VAIKKIRHAFYAAQAQCQNLLIAIGQKNFKHQHPSSRENSNINHKSYCGEFDNWSLVLLWMLELGIWSLNRLGAFICHQARSKAL
jgi:hypothetical protein